MSEKFIPDGFWEKTKFFFFPVGNNKSQTALMILYFIVNASFGILFLFFIRFGVDALASGSRQDFFQVLQIFSGLFFIFLILFFSLGKLGWPYSFNRYRESVEAVFIPRYIQFDTNFQEKVGTGKTISILSKGILMWGTLLDRLIMDMTLFCLSVLVTVYFISQIHSLLLLLFLVLLILAQILGIFLNTFTVKIRKNRTELNNIWSKEMVRIIMSKMEILQSKKIQQEVQQLHDIHEQQIGYNLKMAPYLNTFFSIGHIFTFLILLIVFYEIGNQYFDGYITLGIVSSTTGAILMMQKVFLSTLDFFKNFTKDFSEIENLWDFFSRAPLIQGYEEGNTFSYKTGDISLQNLNYSYEGNKNVFENFDLKITGGRVTAFVGPSGGGKSTLVKLIAGYLKAERGDILIDGQKISETSLKSYYQDVGYLTQEPSVFDGTVRENLMYAIGETHSIATPSVLRTSPSMRETSQEIPLMEGEKTMEKKKGELQPGEESHGGELQLSEQNFEKKLQEIISLAHCEFIFDLPQGLDTEIGERGVKLSGGQKQRLAIAKIFLKNPKIIILDEPTSALDSLSEKKITEAMHNLFQNRTVLVIAHRLQTVKYADDIIVIEQGKIIERGNHESLVEKKGYYAEMLELQSGF